MLLKVMTPILQSQSFSTTKHFHKDGQSLDRLWPCSTKTCLFRKEVSFGKLMCGIAALTSLNCNSFTCRLLRLSYFPAWWIEGTLTGVWLPHPCCLSSFTNHTVTRRRPSLGLKCFIDVPTVRILNFCCLSCRLYWKTEIGCHLNNNHMA